MDVGLGRELLHIPNIASIALDDGQVTRGNTVTSDSKTTTKLNKIKPTGTRVFNVEKEKKPRASASNTSLFRVRLQTRRYL